MILLHGKNNRSNCLFTFLFSMPKNKQTNKKKRKREREKKERLLNAVRSLNLHNLNILLDITIFYIDPGKVSITSEGSPDDHLNRGEIVLIIILPFTFLGLFTEALSMCLY